MNQGVAQLGTMRTGPDLANIGVRSPSSTWHLLHLYNPRITSPGSIMPPFPFLFAKRPISANGPSADALQLGGDFAAEDGYEVVPTEDAFALVAYLQLLKLSTHEIPEAAAARIDSELK